ncbi:hypothetical protein ILYODFUR_014688, partial [Ilyodon furcidens]
EERRTAAFRRLRGAFVRILLRCFLSGFKVTGNSALRGGFPQQHDAFSFPGIPLAPCSEWRTYWFCFRSTDRNTGTAEARLHVPCWKSLPTERFSLPL